MTAKFVESLFFVVFLGVMGQGRSKSTGKCACIFDFDDTIRLSSGSVAPEYGSVADMCIRSGYGTGIASASCTVDFQKRYLHDRVNSSIFSWSFLGSGAYQTCEGWKKLTLKRIADYYSTPSACTMFFDNTQSNQVYTQQLGGVFQLVSPSSGVTLHDLSAANTTLQQQCSCVPLIKQQGPASGQAPGTNAAGRRLKL